MITILGSEKVTCAHRPTSYPQYGSEVETIFEEFRTQWLSHRPGNLAEKREIRSINNEFQAKNDVLLTPDLFFQEFESFLTGRRTKIRSHHPKSIELEFIEGMKRFSFVGIPKTYDDEFIVSSAVDIKEYTIERNAVKIDELRYSNLELANFKLSKSKTPVRIEPENPYIVYALCDNRWISCVSQGAVEFAIKNPVDKMIETMRIRGAGSVRHLSKKFAMSDKMERIERADKNFDETRKAKNVIVSAPPVKDDVFKRAREIDINKLNILTREDLNG